VCSGGQEVLEFSVAAPLLQAAGMCQAASEPLDLAHLADELEETVDRLEYQVELLENAGLLIQGEPGHAPLLLRAGRQYLARNGDLSQDILAFLPHTVDDLVARRALLTAGSLVVDEFRSAILSGRAIEHARELVPVAFANAVTDEIAFDLYAAAVALMVRLSDEQPAGCVAEEVLAVALIAEAEAVIESLADRGEVTSDDAATAAGELRALFELFQDDDVLNLFDMREPSDAAVQGQSYLHRQLGVVDQRVEAWFAPFGWVIPTGYLHDNGEVP
jgi:hypothetical protein